MEIKETDRGLRTCVTVRLPNGLHARPSARIAQIARKYRADVLIIGENGEVDAKSMLDVLSLASKKDDQLCLLAKGEEARTALKELASYLSGREI